MLKTSSPPSEVELETSNQVILFKKSSSYIIEHSYIYLPTYVHQKKYTSMYLCISCEKVYIYVSTHVSCCATIKGKEFHKTTFVKLALSFDNRGSAYEKEFAYFTQTSRIGVSGKRRKPSAPKES